MSKVDLYLQTRRDLVKLLGDHDTPENRKIAVNTLVLQLEAEGDEYMIDGFHLSVETICQIHKIWNLITDQFESLQIEQTAVVQYIVKQIMTTDIYHDYIEMGEDLFFKRYKDAINSVTQNCGLTQDSEVVILLKSLLSVCISAEIVNYRLIELLDDQDFVEISSI